MDDNDIPVFRPIDTKKEKEISPIDSPSIESKIDAELLKVRDKIKLQDDVRNNPPEKGEMSVEIPDGTYVVDLNALLKAQLSDCPAQIIPMLIDHGVRVAVDIKETYRPEKRVIPFQYWWVFVLVLGLVGIVFLALSMFGVI